MTTDRCEWCGIELSARFGFGCCDECASRLADEREAEERRDAQRERQAERRLFREGRL